MISSPTTTAYPDESLRYATYTLDVTSGLRPMDQRNGNAVVVPAVDSASSVCFLRSLGERAIPTIAVSEMESPPAFSSRYCEETVRVPSFRDDVVAYKDGLLSVARRDDVGA